MLRFITRLRLALAHLPHLLVLWTEKVSDLRLGLKDTSVKKEA